MSAGGAGISVWRDDINPGGRALIVRASMLVRFRHSHPGGRDKNKNDLLKLQYGLDATAPAMRSSDRIGSRRIEVAWRSGRERRD
jgi:hypothetical protein